MERAPRAGPVGLECGLDRIAPLLLKAVIAGEDQKFCLHRGFDGEAIAAARFVAGDFAEEGAAVFLEEVLRQVRERVA